MKGPDEYSELEELRARVRLLEAALGEAADVILVNVRYYAHPAQNIRQMKNILLDEVTDKENLGDLYPIKPSKEYLID